MKPGTVIFNAHGKDSQLVFCLFHCPSFNFIAVELKKLYDNLEINIGEYNVLRHQAEKLLEEGIIAHYD